MRTRVISTLLVSMTLITTACGSPMNTPDIKLNPHPMQRYEITVTTDAPGPFDKVMGSASYAVSNVECTPKDNFEGVHAIPTDVQHVIQLTRVDNRTYQGFVYLDQVQDDDYFGLGVCHWQLTSASADLEVHGMTFGAGLRLDELKAQESTTWYLLKSEYLDSSHHETGASVPMNDYIAKHPDKFFSVTVIAKRTEP